MDKKLPAEFAKAFKDADIRGITGVELDDDVAYAVARVFVGLQRAGAVVVGRDVRVSSPSLVEAFMAGAQDAGADVIDIGLAHSPMLYFASGTLNVPGVMVTASHSPKEYNGLKLVAPGAVPLTNATGLKDILRRIQKNELGPLAKQRGRRRVKDMRKAYQRFILKGFKKKQFAGITVAADAGNGMAALLLPLLQEQLPVQFSTVSMELDGTFPTRGSDPTLQKNQRQLKQVLKEQSHDFGIAFDGDADRIAFLDEKGRYVNCAVIGAIIAERLLAVEPGAGIVFTNLTSRVFEERIKASGGKALRARVGHAFLKRKMRETGAVFGAEHSGHFFFRDFFYTDSVVLTLRYVLEAYAEAKVNDQSFSEMARPYQRYQQLEDTVIPVTDKQAVLQAVEKYVRGHYKDARLRKFDGWYLELPDAWGAIKPSVTEHALKVMFEGSTKKAAKQVQDDLVEFIRAAEKRS
jgi:phosphomannomutase